MPSNCSLLSSSQRAEQTHGSLPYSPPSPPHGKRTRASQGTVREKSNCLDLAVTLKPSLLPSPFQEATCQR